MSRNAPGPIRFILELGLPRHGIGGRTTGLWYGRLSAAYVARLRDEIDLDALTAHLWDVVDETMEPTTVSLWLKGREFSGELVR